MDNSSNENVYRALKEYIELSLVSPRDPQALPLLQNGEQDGSYIPLTGAVERDYTGLVNRDLPALGEAGFTIALRFEWPGYPPQDFQLRTYDWCKPPNRIRLSKLATEAAKIVCRFIEKIQGQTIAPEHTRWRVGPEGIQVKDLRLAALEQVSTGSWQPRLFYDPPICTPQPDL